MAKAKKEKSIEANTQESVPTVLHVTSKLPKSIKKIKEPVPRYFESLNQIQGYWSEGEYDLMEIFKLLKHEAYFAKSVQKKLSSMIKAGFEIHSDDDQIKEYLSARFTLMELQTGTSLKKIIETIGFYLIVCSNAYLIKVRDKNFEHANSYEFDGKEQAPVTGLFLAHPTSIKPRFLWVKFNSNGQIRNKLELVKWVYVNRRGIISEFEPEDVVHFSLYKEDGMVYGTPEVIPVIDDIRTLRKLEEDVELLVQRDLFPIIHYAVENPGIIGHQEGITELEQARRDLERMMQDGGIATDARHKIQYVGSGGKYIEIKPYIEYFQNRVFSGLGVSQTDMGNGSDISGNTASSMSKQLMDSVRFIQQELTRQFDESVLTELILQSPFGNKALHVSVRPTLKFEEIDIEWKIRKENHDADRFNKGILTIDEVRNNGGHRTLDESMLDRTHSRLYSMAEIEFKNKLKGEDALKNKNDSVKRTGSNSNITVSNRKKKHSDSINFLYNDKDIATEFKYTIDTIVDSTPVEKKFTVKAATKTVYDIIYARASEQYSNGIEDAIDDIGINTEVDRRYIGTIKDSINDLSDSITKMVLDDLSKSSKAALRIKTADKTEQVRAYNIGYAEVAMANNIYTFDLIDYITDDIKETKTIKSIADLPPYHPNSTSIVKVHKQETKENKTTINDQINIDKEIMELTGSKFSSEYISSKYGYNINDFIVEEKEVVLNDNIEKDNTEDLETLISSIKELYIKMDSIINATKSFVTKDELHILKDTFSKSTNRIKDMIQESSGSSIKSANKYIESVTQIVDSIKEINNNNISSLKTIADAIPKEIKIESSPIEVQVNNPPIEMNLSIKDSEKQVQSKKNIQIVRNEFNQIVSAHIEENV